MRCNPAPETPPQMPKIPETIERVNPSAKTIFLSILLIQCKLSKNAGLTYLLKKLPYPIPSPHGQFPRDNPHPPPREPQPHVKLAQLKEETEQTKLTLETGKTQCLI